MDLKLIEKKLIEFRDSRGWGKDHTGPELARALIIEAGELNELFLWGAEPSTAGGTWWDLRAEIADNFIYLIYLCLEYDINPADAIHSKIDQNAIKYPNPNRAKTILK